MAQLVAAVRTCRTCRTLPERCGVVGVPDSAFYGNEDAGRTEVRFAFCKQEPVLVEAVARLHGQRFPVPR